MNPFDGPEATPVVFAPDGAAATVPGLIRAQAQRSPDVPAVESAGEHLTYGQLLVQAEGLARHLLGLGVGPGDLVAVAVPRGVDLVPALLGVQLAGAAYVPLDPEHPAERLNDILRDCAARVLVTADAAGSPGLRTEVRVHLDDVPLRHGTAPLPAPDPDSTAYVIYTSGSTGRPKGVAVAHRALGNFIASMRERLALPDDVVLPAVTTVSFDIAGLELFLPLTTGGRVVLAPQAVTADPRRLAELLAGTDARVMQATPVAWRLLLEAGWSAPPGFTVLCGGERLPAELADRLLGDQVVLWDLYGPTETTIWSSLTRYERGADTRFHPVRATSLHVLDHRLEPVPAGDPGELYIGGSGLATGYLGRPDLTAQRFVADPFANAPGARLYRTGDVARLRPDGRIEILGRNDDQIKLRGFRIEPGEIEHVLNGHPDVAEAAVRVAGLAEEAPRLVGYVRAADPASPPDSRRLRLHAARSLPAYMVPAQFVVLAGFPRTHNGKLDRAALPAPPVLPGPGGPADDAGAVAHEDGRPAGGTEQRVAQVLAEVLERPEIGPHEDFFTLGGDSLRAVQAILTLNAELNREVPINALFEARTAYGLALLLNGDDAAEPELTALPADRAPRLSWAQWRSWLHQQRVPDCTADNRPLTVRLPGPLDVPALESAVTGLLARHEVLRTRYEYDSSGQPVPVADPAEPVRLAPEDGDPRAVLAAELARPFDLSKEPPVRIRLLRDAGQESALLLLVLHRIAADDRSCDLVAKQIRAAYRTREVPAPPLRYPDYASWQRELVASPAGRRHLDFWRTALTGLKQAGLRTDRPRPFSRDWQGGTVRFGVSPEAAGSLRQLAFEHDAPASMGLLAAFFAVLDRHSDGTDLTVGVPMSTRRRPELMDLVGVFEEAAVVRADLQDAPTFRELLVRVRDAALAAHRHAVLPLEEIVAGVLDVVDTEPAPGRSPLFDVTFSAQGVPIERTGFPLPDAPGTKHDLSLRLADRADGGIDGRLDYATQLFDEATAARIADDYARLLAEAVGSPAHERVGSALLDPA
ncbi:amino acid adenylation domain-containing protein [Streptomyces sp. NPDC093982]|uniref:amino acid adenylation domain-containing protein n=1 Tax=Streptomyces sp. NPDC093982 TaxID=3155077 RepID=UPI00341EC4D0